MSSLTCADRVGQADTERRQDIVLSGAHIKEEHCIFRSERNANGDGEKNHVGLCHCESVKRRAAKCLHGLKCGCMRRFRKCLWPEDGHYTSVSVNSSGK